MAGNTYIVGNIYDFVRLLQGFNAKPGGKGMDAVYNCYVVPKKFANYDEQSREEGGVIYFDWEWYGLDAPVEDNYEVNKPTTLDGYSPKNNKMKVFPFVALEVNNNNGVSNILQYELFDDNNCDFIIKGVPVVGCSIKLVPKNYKRKQGEINDILNEEEGIIAGKLPTLNWSENNYLMWISQQAVNLNQGLQSAGLQFVGGVVASAVGLPTVRS